MQILVDRAGTLIGRCGGVLHNVDLLVKVRAGHVSVDVKRGPRPTALLPVVKGDGIGLEHFRRIGHCTSFFQPDGFMKLVAVRDRHNEKHKVIMPPIDKFDNWDP